MNSDTATRSTLSAPCLAGAIEQRELSSYEYHDFEARTGVDDVVVDTSAWI
jgi:hypothetical protein